MIQKKKLFLLVSKSESDEGLQAKIEKRIEQTEAELNVKLEIVPVNKCNNAFRVLSQDAYDITVICIKDRFCYSHGIKEIINSHENNKIHLVLEEDFTSQFRSRLLLFTPTTKSIHLRKIGSM